MTTIPVTANSFQLTRLGLINCYLVRESDGFTLIDTGLPGTADDILAAARTLNAPIRRIKEKLVEQFCVLVGGPCIYTGRTMKRSHEGQNIDRAAFDALVENLQKAMDKNGVPFHSQNRLLAKLAPMYRDIQDRD